MLRKLRPPSARVLLLALSLAVASTAGAQTASSFDPRVEALLERMTLEEKVGEMTQLTLTAITRTAGTATRVHELDSVKLENAIVRNHVGSVLNVADVAFTAEHWHEVITTIQRAAQRKRLRIPVLYGIDAVHGHNYLRGATIFPQNLAMAATWNPELVRRSNEITAIEMRATGIRWNFSPVLDLGRHPAWSRFFETFGEDVHLASVMGTASVRGLQGDTAARGAVPVAATAKHFLGYSMPRTGKDRTPAWIPDRMLHELFVPPFRAAIDAGVRSIMVNSADVNLVPVHSSREMLTDLLRNQLGFDGVVVSDWEDIIRLHTVHRVAETPKSAVRMAILAGIDMSMVPYDLSFATHLIELVREGSISEERIEESVRRILKLKFDTGLFDNPFPDYGLMGRIGAPDFHAVSRLAAEEAVTLLENRNGILPLNATRRVLVTGPGANSLPAAHGGWTYSWQGTNADLYPRTSRTLLQALQTRMGSNVTYVPGTEYEKEIDIAAAVQAARSSDVAIIALAERPSTEKPGDIEDLELPEPQLRLTRAIQATGIPTVLVLMENRPRIVRPIVDSARAVLLAYQAGPYSGDAVADVLLGTVNPSGRLPFTYPRYANSLVHYDHTYSEKIGPSTPEEGYNPQWPFGHGLSFTTFEYSDLTVAPELARAQDTLTISVRITNTGRRAGKEVVQLYVRDLYATIAPPDRRLRAFEKILLAPGATRVVTFRLPVSDLAFIGRDHRPVLEPGRFDVVIGPLEKGFEAR